MIRYYANTETETAEPVECEDHGWPNRDVTGRVQMDNTHYDREFDAWLHLLTDAEAGVTLTIGSITRLRSQLDEATKLLVENELEVHRIKRKIEKRFGKEVLDRNGVEDGAEP